MKAAAKMMIGADMRRFVLFFISFFMVSLPILPAVAAGTFDGLMGMNVGYDDNTFVSEEQKQSGFLSYHTKLGFRFFSDKYPTWENDVFAEGFFREYLGLDSNDNNYRMRIGGYSTWAIADGRLMPGIFGNATAYRDSLNRFDEKDGLMIGAKIDWLASARLTLRLQHTLNRLFHKSLYSYSAAPRLIFGSGGVQDSGNISSGGNAPITGNPPNIGNPPNTGNAGIASKIVSSNFTLTDMGVPMPPSYKFFAEAGGGTYKTSSSDFSFADRGAPMPVSSLVYLDGTENRRTESVSAFGVRGIIYLFSYLQSEISAEYVSSDFSDYPQSYIGKGIEFSLIWMPTQEWEITSVAHRKYFEFRNSPDGTNWRNTERGIGLNIRRFFRSSEIFFRIDLTDYHSDFEDRTYRRTVTQCGAVWSF